jgi:integrase
MSRPRKADRHLPPCVHQRHGAYYFVKKGKWTRLGATLTESMIEYSRIVGTPSGGMSDLIDRAYEAACKDKQRKLSDSTKRQYKYNAGHLRRKLAEFDPQQVKPKHVAQLRAEYHDKPNMGNQLVSFLKVVFDYALQWGEVESNPCIGSKRQIEDKRGRYLTDAEYQAIRAHAEPRMQIIMDVCFLTGQRISDVLKIRLSDITPDGLAFTQQKTGKRLVVAWSKDLHAAVDAAKELTRGRIIKPTTLFCTTGGTAPGYSYVRVQWAKACALAGVTNANLHDLRAKSGTDAEKQGMDPTALLGHSDKKQTETYLRDRQIPVVTGPSFGLSKRRS